MKKLIGWELAVFVFCVITNPALRSAGVLNWSPADMGLGLAICSVAAAFLATTRHGHVAALATAVATAALALVALGSSVSTTGAPTGELALIAFFIAILATVTAGQLRVKYWLALVSMLVEGAAIFVLC